jgi:hypothetical protein
MENLFPSFTYLSLSVRCTSYRQQMVESCLLIRPIILCLLIGELIPLTFSVTIERYAVIPVIVGFFCDVCFFPNPPLSIHLSVGFILYCIFLVVFIFLLCLYLIPVVFDYCERSWFFLQLWRILFLYTLSWQLFSWKFCCPYLDGFHFIYDLLLLSCSFQYLVFVM